MNPPTAGEWVLLAIAAVGPLMLLAYLAYVLWLRWQDRHR